MAAIMEKEWIPVVATLLGVIVGGLITSVVKVIELRHQKNQAMLARLELLYESLMVYQRMNFDYVSEVNRLFGQKVSDEKKHEMTLGLMATHEKINTLLSFYSPHLFQKGEALATALLIFQHHGLSILNNEDENLDKFHKEYYTANRLGIELMVEVQKHSTKYTGSAKLPDAGDAKKKEPQA
jgi:glycerol uptake facilitator-like aquaporin